MDATQLKQRNVPGALKLFSIISYLLIFLMGDVIGLPLLCWLPLTLFDFGTFNQLFSALALTGLIFTFFTLRKARTYRLLPDVLCLGLLLSPLLWRMSVVPFEKFNYWLFSLPAAAFLLLYLLSMYFSVKQNHS